MVGAALNDFGITVDCVDTVWHNKTRRALVARFTAPWESTSWALLGGGLAQAQGYVCCEVRNEDLPLGVEPAHVLNERMRALPISSGADSKATWVATMTSANVAAFACGIAREGETMACALVTAGFANALRVGEPSQGRLRSYLPGTINLVCWINQPLTLAGKLEALSISAQARTLEVLDAQLPSLDDSGWATGTGTDCIVMFTPVPAADQTRVTYTGMHTALGRVVGGSVRQAMRGAIEGWRKRVQS